MLRSRRTRFLWLAAALAASAGPASAQRLFRDSEPTRLPLAGFATDLLVDDLDRDQRLDIAVAHADVGRVSVLWSARGAGDDAPFSFATTTHAVGLGPLFVASGDLDGDGAPDLVAASSGSATVSVLLQRVGGNGSATLAAARELAVGPNPRAVAVADLDADGDLDLVTINFPAFEVGSLSILLGDGRGAFAGEMRHDIGDNPHALVVDDFDGDGILDVAVAHTFTVSCFRGEGAARFAPAVRTTIPVANPRAMVRGDFDRDAMPDLAVLADESGFQNGWLFFVRNTGSGSFEPRLVSDDAGSVPNPFTQNFGFLAVSDVDADGDDDLVTQLDIDRRIGVRIHTGAGDGTFVERHDWLLGERPADAEFADIDGDGVPDLIAAIGSSITVYRGIAPGTIDVRESVLLAAPPREIVAVPRRDASGVDLWTLSSRVVERLSRVEGRFAVTTRAEFAAALVDLACADLDGDGIPELALLDLLGRVIVVALDDESPPAIRGDFAVGAVPSAIAAADFDGDRVPELVVADRADTALRIVFAPLDGERRETRSVDLGSGQTAVAAGDIDGDGDVDLVASTRDGVRVLAGDGRGDFEVIAALDAFANARALRIADTDADGTAELIVIATSGVSLSMVRDLVADDPWIETFEERLAYSSVEVRDVDGDGRPDLVATTGASRGSIAVRRGDNDGRFAALELYQVGDDPRSVALADFDGDGVLDAATADFASRTVSILPGVATPRADNGRFRRGDVDADGRVLLSDAVRVLEALFLAAASPACLDAGDADDDGRLALTDAIVVLAYLFQGGTAPPAPGPQTCGSDPTTDELAACGSRCEP